jgi:ElaB/YqjD/DUF883 family membrane-anchored ribosome-binding protein
MNTKTTLSALVAIVTAFSLTGCDKQQQATPSSTPAAATNGMTATMDTAKDLAGKAVDSTKEAAGKAMDAAKDATATATDAAKDAMAKASTALPTTDAAASKFNEVVANTKQFITDKKYQGALDELKKLSDVKLTDEQQKTVDGLKADVQKWMAGGAGAVNNLLGK